MALTIEVTIEVRNDASRVRHQAAVAVLQALAEGGRDLMSAPMIELPHQPDVVS
ncbi:hypothetical protein [Methylobacterium sp. WL64]|uniref:hypothetical protein n=1 Tax=Methylobacterium sp. WL64 TaxID=2603894 RepID=UPI001AEE1371|nr:hypothetical protein [Methylobacterium sp. WL64]